MEVTTANFKEVLGTLSEVFKKAQFIAFDTEFTGLRLQGERPHNYYDSLEDLYVKYRRLAEKCIAIQYGIVAFIYNEEKNMYSHQAYNFYVFPSALCPEVNFTCQASSLQFLVKHGFDFNKLFTEGIPYLTDVDADRLIEKLEEKHEKLIQAESFPRGELKIPDEHKSTINAIHKTVEELLNSDKKSFTIEKHNSFVRRLIYNSTQDKFGSRVHLETQKDETMVVSLGLTEEEIKAKQKEQFQAAKQEILDAVGFSQVIKLIIESGKTLVGHNLLLDLLYTIQQFVQPLPETYGNFKDLAHFLFPRLVDTKHMATLGEFRDVKGPGLWSLAEHFRGSDSVPELEAAPQGTGYTWPEDKCHEAAYDAFLTGICFLSMTNHIGKLNMTNILKSLPNSPLIEPMVSKLCVPRLHDIPYMNLGGTDVAPSRSNVFHLSFPKEWKRDDIFKLFKDYGFINVSWINDTSAFVGVKKEVVKKVRKNLMKANKRYRLMTYDDFRATGRSADGERTDEEMSFDSPSSRSSSCEKKRMQVEDIGEVIARPQKKICSFETPPFD